MLLSLLQFWLKSMCRKGHRAIVFLQRNFIKTPWKCCENTRRALPPPPASTPWTYNKIVPLPKPCAFVCFITWIPASYIQLTCSMIWIGDAKLLLPISQAYAKTRQYHCILSNPMRKKWNLYLKNTFPINLNQRLAPIIPNHTCYQHKYTAGIGFQLLL